MWDKSIVAAGLALDIVGAVAIVVSDLPNGISNWFRSKTPKIRKYHRISIGLQKKEIDDSELKEAMRTIWPVPINHEGVPPEKRLNPSSVGSVEGDELPFELIDNVHWDEHGHAVIMKNENGNHLIGPHWENIVAPLEKEISKIYRIYGVALLSIGFSLQLVGTLLL